MAVSIGLILSKGIADATRLRVTKLFDVLMIEELDKSKEAFSRFEAGLIRLIEMHRKASDLINRVAPKP